MRSSVVAVIFVGLFMLAVSGCAVSERNLTGLEVGMARTDVMRLLGKPDEKVTEGKVEVYRYRLAGGMQLKDDIKEPTHYVRLVEGRVESFGRVDGGNINAGKGATINVNVKGH